VTTQVATFQVVGRLGLFNTRWSAIALFLGTDIISIYIFQQFLRGIPRELDEAAALRFKGPFSAQWEVIAAGAILVIVPTLLVFLALQRFIYNGLTTGATR
jgi:multiple sugar transport system permease protein